MSKPWRSLARAETIEVVAPGGLVRCRLEGWYAGGMFVIEDQRADVRPGDEIRRTLPNGLDDVFVVDDPKFFNAGSFGPHFQVAVSRRGPMEKRTGGNYQIHVTGSNSRVNIGSTDNSVNVDSSGGVFGGLREALNAQVADATTRALLLSKVDAMEAAEGDPTRFPATFQDFMANAANCMTVIGPFIPALAALVAS